ncbi:MAG: 30S ribosomal protein S6 [Sulfurospirillum sp.]|nr:30S ribosomal protein S6 [Sulfurospirillum sp.]
MRHYELLVVVKPTLTVEELQAKLSFLKEILEKNGAVIAATLEMGTRKLAYQIDKFERGTYVVFYFTAPTAAIAEVERLIRITEEFIRFMTVKFENQKELDSGTNKLKKSLKKVMLHLLLNLKKLSKSNKKLQLKPN